MNTNLDLPFNSLQCSFPRSVALELTDLLRKCFDLGFAHGLRLETNLLDDNGPFVALFSIHDALKPVFDEVGIGARLLEGLNVGAAEVDVIYRGDEKLYRDVSQGL